MSKVTAYTLGAVLLGLSGFIVAYDPWDCIEIIGPSIACLGTVFYLYALGLLKWPE